MEAFKVKKNIYTEPEIQVNRLSENDILCNSPASEVNSDDLFDEEDSDN